MLLRSVHYELRIPNVRGSLFFYSCRTASTLFRLPLTHHTTPGAELPVQYLGRSSLSTNTTGWQLAWECASAEHAVRIAVKSTGCWASRLVVVQRGSLTTSYILLHCFDGVLMCLSLLLYLHAWKWRDHGDRKVNRYVHPTVRAFASSSYHLHFASDEWQVALDATHSIHLEGL